MKKQIYLAPYSDLWPLVFEKERSALLQSIGGWVEDIEHVGSTAIPGIAAKPIIDIVIGVRSLGDADQNCIPAIQRMGYVYLQEYEDLLPNRRYFHKITSSGYKTHQIHLVEIDSDFWERHLLFRNYLRTHPEVAREYECLKKSLAKSCKDTHLYADAKTPFIRKVEAQARADLHIAD